MKKEVIGDCTLYLGDCRDILSELEMVDHVITDPPYEEEAHKKGRRLLGKQRNGNRTVEYAELDFDPISMNLRKEFCEKIKVSGWILAFCQAEAIATYRENLINAGYLWKRAMVWIKPDGAATIYR